MAYRGPICNQKGCPLVHLIIGKLYAKPLVPNSRHEKVISQDKVISYLSFFQDVRTSWLEVLYIIERDVI